MGYDDVYEMIVIDFQEALKKYNISIEKIRSRRREKILVDLRQRIASDLKAKGYSFPMIGDVMNRHHTSVIHLVKERLIS